MVSSTLYIKRKHGAFMSSNHAFWCGFAGINICLTFDGFDLIVVRVRACCKCITFMNGRRTCFVSYR